MAKNWYSSLNLNSIVVCLLLASCNPAKKEDKLNGTWKIEQLDMNGTVLGYNDIGKPMIRFMEGGKYSISILEYEEKGTYTLTGTKLTYDCNETRTSLDSPFVANKELANRVFSILKMDSATMEYASATGEDKTITYLAKVKSE